MNEIWKPVVGFESKYLVSNFGNVIGLTYNKKLKFHYGSCGYLNVFLYNGKNQKKTKKIHRLVAQAFIPNNFNKPQVNHIDCNKHNNRVDNLEWVTNLENQQHAVKHGLKGVLLGEDNCLSKFSNQQISQIKDLINNGVHKKQIMLEFGISNTHFYRVKNGDR